MSLNVPPAVMDFYQKYFQGKQVSGVGIIDRVEKGVKDGELTVREALMVMQAIDMILFAQNAGTVEQVMNGLTTPHKPDYIN